MRTRSLILAASALLAAGGFLATMQSFASSPEPTASEAQSLATATFVVDNMSCATCPITVKAAMSKVPGVRSVDVDFKTKTATVTYDRSLTTPDAIAAASTNAGYPARLAS